MFCSRSPARVDCYVLLPEEQQVSRANKTFAALDLDARMLEEGCGTFKITPVHSFCVAVEQIGQFDSAIAHHTHPCSRMDTGFGGQRHPIRRLMCNEY